MCSHIVNRCSEMLSNNFKVTETAGIRVLQTPGGEAHLLNACNAMCEPAPLLLFLTLTSTL